MTNGLLENFFSGTAPDKDWLDIFKCSDKSLRSNLHDNDRRMTSTTMLTRDSNCSQKQQYQHQHQYQHAKQRQHQQHQHLGSAKLKPSFQLSQITGSTGVGIEDRIIDEFISALVKKDVRLCCFDFDMTVVDPKYSYEFQTPQDVCKRLSHLFIKLAKKLLKSGIFVTIVTYNSSPLIKPSISSMIGYDTPVFSRDDHRLETGKAWHLDQAIQFCNSKFNTSDRFGMRPQNVLLIDDDPNNAMNAARTGFHVINNKSVICLDDLVGFINQSNQLQTLVGDIEENQEQQEQEILRDLIKAGKVQVVQAKDGGYYILPRDPNSKASNNNNLDAEDLDLDDLDLDDLDLNDIKVGASVKSKSQTQRSNPKFKPSLDKRPKEIRHITSVDDDDHDNDDDEYSDRGGSNGNANNHNGNNGNNGNDKLRFIKSPSSPRSAILSDSPSRMSSRDDVDDDDDDQRPPPPQEFLRDVSSLRYERGDE